MAKLSHVTSRRMYSWWWDSHISSMNSKWLQENLTDMDVKVKSMIKLIEQDADSFAKRAEMYYEKRPELMKMVEDFYRAYRALAERYDHATGALRQAHQTMTEVFPIENDELASDSHENVSQILDHDSFRNGNDLKFGENLKEIDELGKVLARFEAEKELSLAQYKQSSETFSYQELKFSSVQEEISQRIKEAENEVEILRKALKALEMEKETGVVQNQKYLEKIEDMENIISSAQKDVLYLSEKVSKGETEAQTLKLELGRIESEKAASLRKCEEYLEKMSELEKELVLAEVELKSLRDENMNLKEIRENESRENLDILNKSDDLEKVIEEKTLLEKSVLDLRADLERNREEKIAKEKSFESLSGEKLILDSEKTSLVTQLQVAAENLKKLSEKKTVVEKSVSEAHNEIEGLKMRLISIENSSQLLENEKIKLVSQVEITSQTLEDIERKYQRLEEKHSDLEKEKESTKCEIEELQQIVKESKQKEAKQIIENENLRGKVLDMQKKIVTLQEENLKVIDEKISLVKDFLNFQEKNNTSIKLLKEKISNLEGENEEKGAQLAAYAPAISSLENCISSLEKSADFSVQLQDDNNEKVKAVTESEISTLEGENEEKGAQLAAYAPVISSLENCISSLEKSADFSVKLQDGNNEKVKAVTESIMVSNEVSSINQDKTDKHSELQKLEARVQAIMKTVTQTNSKLESATRQIEELGSKRALNQDNTMPISMNPELENALLTKDIMLDQMSKCPSYVVHSQVAESDYMIVDSNGYDSIASEKEDVDFRLALTVERDGGIDKLEVADSFSRPKQGLDKAKVLKRLNSDSQKLTELQLTVQDLKKQAEMTEKSMNGKSFGECERIRWHLGKAEEDIMLLSDLNGKLIKSLDKPDDVVESEQERKASERIGKLQLEVKEIQSIMLKLDGENGKEKIKSKSETTDTKRTLFSNYPGRKTSNKKKKRSFCGFVQPPTAED